MALYAIGDPHLSLGAEKPMDIFCGWQDYTQRLAANWQRLVTPQDTVLLCGDISWAMKLEACMADFSFLNTLPGRKILLKGNHDYWWTTRAKMERFCAENGFDTLHFLQNDSYVEGDVTICGTRGWLFDLEDPQDEKVHNRELGRLKASLESAKKPPIIAFLHYPPIYQNQIEHDFIDLLKAHGVSRCYYGHLHGKSCNYAFQGDYEGISFRLISADYLGFCPIFISQI